MARLAELLGQAIKCVRARQIGLLIWTTAMPTACYRDLQIIEGVQLGLQHIRGARTDVLPCVMRIQT